jgi:hypothetical protein
MYRNIVYLFLLFAAPALAALYGFVHDQFTYTICPEFFTKFRFLNYEFPELWHPRTSAGVIGILNSWKIGIPLGIVLTWAGYFHREVTSTLKHTLITYAMVFFFVTMMAFVGYSIEGTIAPKETFFPDGLIDRANYIRVLNMNNYATGGAVLGMLLGVMYHLFIIKKNK